MALYHPTSGQRAVPPWQKDRQASGSPSCLRREREAGRFLNTAFPESFIPAVLQALASGPGALFLGADAAGSTADLAAKVKEDPLFLIRKKEEEARQRLASNPVKMKQLQQLFAEEKSSKSRKRRDRSRSPVKKKHSHRFVYIYRCLALYIPTVA